MSDEADDWWQTETKDAVPTSPDLWRPLSRAMDGFDLDPAAGCEPTPIAETRYTPEDDGLTSPWFGTVWLNPPFSDKTPWYKRAVNQLENGDADAVVALATVDTSADWFHDWFATADVVAYLDGRDWYLGYDGTPTFSTQVGIWQPTEDAIMALDRLGTVVRPLSDPRYTQQTITEVSTDE